jgi:hypothetical protein
MTLDQFRKSKGWSYAQLARLTECSHATVARRWCLPISHPAKSVPGVRYMKRIIALSDGAVQPNSFYPIGLND